MNYPRTKMQSNNYCNKHDECVTLGFTLEFVPLFILNTNVSLQYIDDSLILYVTVEKNESYLKSINALQKFVNHVYKSNLKKKLRIFFLNLHVHF